MQSRHNCILPLLRLLAIAATWEPVMERVQILTPPKDVDARVLAWKGGSVLARMEAVQEMWVSAADWVRIHDPSCTSLTMSPQDVLGMRGLKERCFFL